MGLLDVNHFECEFDGIMHFSTSRHTPLAVSLMNRVWTLLTFDLHWDKWRRANTNPSHHNHFRLLKKSQSYKSCQLSNPGCHVTSGVGTLTAIIQKRCQQTQ